MMAKLELPTRLARGLRRADYQLRRTLCRALREARTRAPGPPPAPRLRRLAVVLPDHATEAMLGDAVNRVAWYLGAVEPRRELSIDFHVPRRLLRSVPTAPATQRDYTARLPADARLVERGHTLARYDDVAVWSARSVLAPDVAAALARVSVLDPTFFRSTEFSTFERLMARSVDQSALEPARELSRRNLARLVETHGGAASYALGTGPSLAQLERHRFQGAVVSCNGIVCEPRLMARLRPAAVCFADPIFFAPNRFAASLRDGALEAVARYGTFVVVPLGQVPLLARQHPELAEHLIGLDTTQALWHVPSASEPSIRPTDNVLTMLVLPLCCALARTVHIAGCDGVPPGSRPATNWRHAAANAESLSATAMVSHPAFYRDRDYGDDFARHYDLLERALTHWETAGWWFDAPAHSWIPALVRRRIELDALRHDAARARMAQRTRRAARGRHEDRAATQRAPGAPAPR